MPRRLPDPEEYAPFANLTGWKFIKRKDGYGQCILEVSEKHFNPIRRVHGGVIYSLADDSMAGAIYSLLDEDDIPTTIEVKINYFLPVTSGLLSCKSKTIHVGAKIAVAESEIYNESSLIAKAVGTYHIAKNRDE